MFLRWLRTVPSVTTSVSPLSRLLLPNATAYNTSRFRSLKTVGLLNLNTGDLVGFDIQTERNGKERAFAALQPNGGSVSRLYLIDLTTGKAQNRGVIGAANLAATFPSLSEIAGQKAVIWSGLVVNRADLRI